MDEENLKKVLYLILKVVIKNNGFISQLEIFKDVRNLMLKQFNVRESDFLIKIEKSRPGHSFIIVFIFKRAVLVFHP